MYLLLCFYWRIFLLSSLLIKIQNFEWSKNAPLIQLPFSSFSKTANECPFSSCFRHCSASQTQRTLYKSTEVQREHSNVLCQYFRHKSTILFLGTFPHSQVPHSCVWSCSLSSVTFREAAWRNRARDLVLFCRRWNMMDVCGLLLFPIQLYFWVNLSCRLSRPCNANRQALFSTPPPSFGSSWTAAHLSLMLPLVRFYPECCSLLQYHSSGSVHMVFMSFTAYLSTALSPLAGYT